MLLILVFVLTAVVCVDVGRLTCHCSDLVESLFAFLRTVAGVTSRPSVQVGAHTFGILLLSRRHARYGIQAVRSSLVDLIYSPDHQSSEAALVGKFLLDFEGLVVIERYPLIFIPHDVLYVRFLIIFGFEVVLLHDVVDLLQIKNTGRSGAWACFGSFSVLAFAIWLAACRVFECEGSPWGHKSVSASAILSKT